MKCTVCQGELVRDRDASYPAVKCNKCGIKIANGDGKIKVRGKKPKIKEAEND